jgi:hypothetical protein
MRFIYFISYQTTNFYIQQQQRKIALIRDRLGCNWNIQVIYLFVIIR